MSGDFAEARAAGGRFMRSRLDRAVLTGARLRSLALIDVVAPGCEASGADWTGARLRRVQIEGARLAGSCSPRPRRTTSCSATAGSSWRPSLRRLRDVRLRAAATSTRRSSARDAGGALRGLPAARADFSGATLARVDLRGSELDPVGDVAGLRGAMIDAVQLAGLAPMLARAAGLRVDDD